MTSKADLAVEVTKRIGRGSTTTVDKWLARGCPGKFEDGFYYVGEVAAWALQNLPEYTANNDGTDGIKAPRTHNEDLAYQKAREVEQKRLERASELVEVGPLQDEFANWIVAVLAELDQLGPQLVSDVKSAGCDLNKIRDTVEHRLLVSREQMARGAELFAMDRGDETGGDESPAPAEDHPV